uniref:Ribonuclease H-like domain-containing protein n=1 Tax=Tanacetum cinerariifolium TaxID=118510 RepID=A0A6L2M5G5_TANCI|nr:ribonuclease H-like domain-containing protein [Tanacetum cinerariifolium]
MLLMALSNEHLMTFNQYKDAKSLFAAIKTKFGGNEATKKTQKTLLKQMYENFSATSTESLPSEWNTHVVVWRNKSKLDAMSIDDLYNNFKIIEQEVKGTASSNSSTQNMTFVSSPSTNSTNKVHTAYGVSTASTQVGTASTKTSTANLSDATVYAFLANQLNSYGPKSRETESKNASEDISNELKEYPDAPLVKDRVSDNKYCLVESPIVVEKKTVVHTIAKVKVVRPKQQEKPVRKIVSAKTTAWNEFSSTMASAIICLATNQNFNFSKYIFDHMVKNLENEVKFLMFLRFVQVFLDSQVEGMVKHKEIYVTPSHTKKIFANMKRQGKGFSGKVTPLFETMMVQPQEDMGEDLEIPTNSHHTPTVTQPSTSSQPQQKQKFKKSMKKITEVPQLSDSTQDVADEHVTTTSNDPLLSGEDRLKLTELMELCTQLQSRVLALETTKANQALEIGSLKRRVKKLEKKSSKKTHKLKRLFKIGFSTRFVDTSILDDQEVVSKMEVSTADPVPTAGEVVTTASEVVTTASVEVSTAAITSQIFMDEITLAKALIDIKTSKPKENGIMMQEPSKTPTPRPIDSSQKPLKSKDKGKAKMIELEKPLKRKD